MLGHKSLGMYSVLYSLGAPIYSSAGPCPACKKDSDRNGDHAIVCGSHGERIARNNQLRNAIYQVAASSKEGRECSSSWNKCQAS